MWLYVPGMDSPSALEEEGSNSASRSLWDPATAVWVTSNGTPMPRPPSWRGWKTRPWIALLSGTISRPSMAALGVVAWISSLPASPASRPAAPAAAAAPETNAGSGRRSPALSAQLALDWSSSRTSPGSSPSTAELPSERLWKTWPRSGSMRSGICSARARSGHPIAASASSFWPTARAHEVGDWQSDGRDGTERHTLTGAARLWPTPTAQGAQRSEDVPHATPTDPQRTLATAAAFWPTPTQTDSVSTTQTNRSVSPGAAERPILASAVRSWPTPCAGDADGGTGNWSGNDRDRWRPGLRRASEAWASPTAAEATSSTGGATRQGTDRLQDQAETWATPMARDGKGRGKPRDPGHGLDLSRQVLAGKVSGPPSSPSAPTSRLRLNPRFVEWLMGWPEGWGNANRTVEPTSFASWVTASSLLLRRLLGSRCLGGQG